tara:strand:+ start:1144 stop:1614 length:471 start_codon:yes stop_codon:yes gene_type:complete
MECENMPCSERKLDTIKAIYRIDPRAKFSVNGKLESRIDYVYGGITWETQPIDWVDVIEEMYRGKVQEMKIKMTESIEMSANESGNQSMKVEVDQVLSMDKPWQQKLAQNLIDGGLAIEVKMDEVKKTKKKAKTVAKKATKAVSKVSKKVKKKAKK